MIAAAAALLGAFLQLLYGGAPHRPDPVRPRQQLRGWSGKGPCYVGFALLGAFLALPGGVSADWRPWAGALLVGLALAAGHNPGHGSYLNPGTRTAPDNESVAAEAHLIAGHLGFRDGSVGYDCIGMGLRYGLATLLVAIVAFGTNRCLGTHVAPWYGAVGFGAGIIQLVNWRIGWAKIAGRISPAWLGPEFNNGLFEAANGALLCGGLALACR